MNVKFASLFALSLLLCFPLVHPAEEDPLADFRTIHIGLEYYLSGFPNESKGQSLREALEEHKKIIDRSIEYSDNIISYIPPSPDRPREASKEKQAEINREISEAEKFEKETRQDGRNLIGLYQKAAQDLNAAIKAINHDKHGYADKETVALKRLDEIMRSICPDTPLPVQYVGPADAPGLIKKFILAPTRQDVVDAPERYMSDYNAELPMDGSILQFMKSLGKPKQPEETKN